MPQFSGYSAKDTVRRNTTPATGPQIAKIRILCGKLGMVFDEKALHGCTLAAASNMITRLDAKLLEAGGDVQTGRTRLVDEGMYRTPDGSIYKVQVAIHGSGRLYAKRLVELAEPRQLSKGVRTHEFESEPDAIAWLTPSMRMSQEEAQEFGKLYGTCCRCGITLTDENSIARGIGPICIKYF